MPLKLEIWSTCLFFPYFTDYTQFFISCSTSTSLDLRTYISVDYQDRMSNTIAKAMSPIMDMFYLPLITTPELRRGRYISQHRIQSGLA
jgi:hypothetical protein